MGKFVKNGRRRCLCGNWIEVHDDEGTCAYCGRTLAESREYYHRRNQVRAFERETLRAINDQHCERRKETSRIVAKCRGIDQKRGKGLDVESTHIVAGEGPDHPLNAPRLCPGGPWNHGKCGHKAAFESRWCSKCQVARRKYYGLAWKSTDAASEFRGGEIEHEVAI